MKYDANTHVSMYKTGQNNYRDNLVDRTPPLKLNIHFRKLINLRLFIY